MNRKLAIGRKVEKIFKKEKAENRKQAASGFTYFCMTLFINRVVLCSSNMASKKRRRSSGREDQLSVKLPPIKLQKIELASQPCFLPPHHANTLSILDKQLESALAKKIIGVFCYSVLKTVDTRETHLFRAISTIWVDNIEGEMKSNVHGKHFRACILINVYPIDKMESEGKSQMLQKIMNDPNTELLESEEFHEYFRTEVLNGNHSVTALKRIAYSNDVSEEIKTALGAPHFRYECKLFYDLGKKFLIMYFFLFYILNPTIDPKNANEVSILANKTLLHSKPFSSFDIIKSINQEYLNQATDVIKQDRVLSKEIKEAVVKKFFSPDGKSSNFNAKIKFDKFFS